MRSPPVRVGIIMMQEGKEQEACRMAGEDHV